MRRPADPPVSESKLPFDFVQGLWRIGSDPAVRKPDGTLREATFDISQNPVSG
jgi:hypothetical protein